MMIRDDAKGFHLKTGEGFTNQLMFARVNSDFRAIIVNLNKPDASMFFNKEDINHWTKNVERLQ